MCLTRASPAHGHHNRLIWSQVTLTLSTQSTLHQTHHCYAEKNIKLNERNPAHDHDKEDVLVLHRFSTKFTE